MKIKCPKCKHKFEIKNPLQSAGGKARWEGVSKATRSALAKKGWLNRRKNNKG